ncbi:MAG: hypothetical protein PHC69_00295 [Ruminiclostridium sp.]|nr:hypothetical protein [Ruminiclostridium sp.]
MSEVIRTIQAKGNTRSVEEDAIYSTTSCIVLAFYGTLALAYDTLGVKASWVCELSLIFIQ